MLIPYVDTVYQFKWTSPFQIFDGIYKVLRIMTFDEVLLDGQNLAELYKEAGKTENDYSEDAIILRADKILKLQDISNEENVRYIPYSLARLEPDPNVKRYANLALAVDIGVFDELESIEFAKHTVESIIDKGLGVQQSGVLFSTQDVWLTEAEYTQYKKERSQRKQGLVNLYSEVHRLRKELDSANVKLAYYENKLIALGNSVLNPDTTYD